MALYNKRRLILRVRIDQTVKGGEGKGTGKGRNRGDVEFYKGNQILKLNLI